MKKLICAKMKRYNWLVLLAAGLIVVSLSTSAGAALFEDDFNTGTLDTTKWKVYWHSSVGPDYFGLAGVSVVSNALHITGNMGYKASAYTMIPGELPESYVLEFDYMRPTNESTQSYAINVFAAPDSTDGSHTNPNHYTRVWSTTGWNAKKFEAAGSSTDFVMDTGVWYSIRSTVVDETGVGTGWTTWEIYTQGFGSLLGTMTFPTWIFNVGIHTGNSGGIYFEAHIDDTAMTPPTGGFFIDNVSIYLDCPVRNPSPTENATIVNPNVILTWDDTPEPNHNFNVYFGTDSNFPGGPASTGQTTTSFDPSPAGELNLLTTYFWRVDTNDLDTSTIITGCLWSFMTAGQKASSPDPANNETGVLHDKVLSWDNFVAGSQNDVYFDVNETNVTNANSTDITGIYKGRQPGTSFDPFGAVDMPVLTTYFWRIDVVDGGGAVLATGDIWEFTTSDVICAPPLIGDTNGDCIVNFLDVADIANDWLKCNWSPNFLCP